MRIPRFLTFFALSTSLASCSLAQNAPTQNVVPDTANVVPAASSLGMNLNGPADWNTELPFNDLFHLARPWISQKPGAPWGQGPALSLDEHGWIKSLEPGCFAETPVLTDMNGHYPQGDYVVLWEGEGELSVQHAGKIVSNEAHRIVFQPNGRDGVFIQIKTIDAANPIKNVRVLLPGTEETYKQNPFNPTFLKRWSGLNTLRFMDWMQTNGSPIKEWNERPLSSDAVWTTKGIPLETMIYLCNRQKQNGWFCIPAHASDDYVRGFATQLKAGLKPELKAYIEYSNEVWNNQFEQSRYAQSEGIALGIGEKPWDAGWHYTARRSKQIFVIFDEVFGGREAASKRIVRVLASQAANDYVSEQILDFEQAGKSADALAIAPYFGMVSVPRAVDANSKIPSETVQRWTTEQALDFLKETALPDQEAWVKAHKKLVDKHGLRLIAYEGGQHAVGGAGAENNEAMTKLFLDMNRSPRMGQLYKRYLDGWNRNGGELFCVFSSVGGWSKWGSWGLLEHQDDDTPKYRAVVAWNEANAAKK